jgi:hypothetical protein
MKQRTTRAIRLGTLIVLALAFAGCSHQLTEIDASRRDRSSTAWRSWDFPTYEKLVYEATWNGVPAATFTIELVRDDVAGIDVIRGTGETIGLASVAFPFTAVAETTMPRGDPRGTDHVATADMRGKYEAVEMHYDRESGVVTALKTRKGRTDEISVADHGSVDPLSVLYALRRMRLSDGQPATLDVFPGDYLWRVTIVPLGKDTVEVEAGTFEARKLALRRDPIFRVKKNTDARISEAWVSDDEARVPLKMISNVTLGKLTIELVSREIGGAPPPEWKRDFPDDRLPVEEEPVEDHEAQ